MNRDELSAADLLAALDCGLWTGLLLAVEHFAFWGVQQAHFTGYRRPLAYVLGAATLLLGFWRWALLRRRVGGAVALTVLVALAGAADLACYAWRAWQDRTDAAQWGTDATGTWGLRKGWGAGGRTFHHSERT